MKDHVKRIGRFIIVPIVKPLNELSNREYDYVGVNKEYFEEARRNSRYLVIWSPRGERIIMPKEFKPKKQFKKVYNYNDHPMIEWGVQVWPSEKHELDFFEVS